jgi:hypothetical protein
MKRSSIPRRQHEQILTAARLRHQQELDQAKALLGEAEAKLQVVSADRDRIRGERDQFKQDGDAARRETKAANARLTAALTAPAHDPGADRRVVEEWEQALAAHEKWKPRPDGEPLVEGGTGRPMHPAVALRLAMARCQLLEQLLATAEGRPLTEVGS